MHNAGGNRVVINPPGTLARLGAATPPAGSQQAIACSDQSACFEVGAYGHAVVARGHAIRYPV